MSGLIITAAPTMANPNALRTVPELRAELERANGHLLELAAHVHHMSGLAERLSNRLVVLVKLHQAGDEAGLRAELEDLTAHYLRQLKNPEATH